MYLRLKEAGVEKIFPSENDDPRTLDTLELKNRKTGELHKGRIVSLYNLLAETDNSGFDPNNIPDSPRLREIMKKMLSQ